MPDKEHFLYVCPDTCSRGSSLSPLCGGCFHSTPHALNMSCYMPCRGDNMGVLSQLIFNLNEAVTCVWCGKRGGVEES